MKKYIAPELEMMKFNAEDIITTSGGGAVVPANQLVGNTDYTLNAAMADIEFNQ